RKSNGEWSVTRAVEDIEVPRTIHALIAARLDGLPSEEKSILQDAAVVGRVFWSGAAARLADRSRQEAHDLFGRLRLKDVVVLREPPAFSGEVELAFRHALIRDVAYDSLPKSLRASKHAEVARWAEGRAGERRDEFAELIATHLTEALSYLDELGDAAGDRREIERQACRWARSAGKRAARLWQMPDAVRWYQTALDLAEGAGIDDHERALLWSAYARACRGVRPFEEVESAYQQALDLFLSLGNEELAGRTEADLAQIAFQLGHDADVIPRVESAMRRLEPLGDSRHLAQALNTLGWYHWRRGRSAEGEPFLRRAIEVADRVGARVVMADALQTLGILLSTTGRWREGLPMVEESYALAKETQNLHLFLRACNNLPSILWEYSPDYQRVWSILEEGLQLARKAATPDMQAWILGTSGYVLTERGDLAEAERCMTEALEIAESIAERPLIGMRANELAWVKLLRGDIDAGATLQARAYQILQENPELQNEGGLVVVGALVAAAQGDPARELAILVDGAGRLAPEDRHAQGTDAMLLEAIRALRKAGRAGEARPFAEALRDIAEDRVTAAARLGWAEGLLAGDDATSAELLRDAIARLEALGFRIDTARCLTDLAEAERRAGKDFRTELERARTIFQECGAKLFLRDFDELPSR
ncbi:MAG: tetratricopeptide repeat protein, partial [Actinomycetota bacterium]